MKAIVTVWGGGDRRPRVASDAKAAVDYAVAQGVKLTPADKSIVRRWIETPDTFSVGAGRCIGGSGAITADVEPVEDAK